MAKTRSYVEFKPIAHSAFNKLIAHVKITTRGNSCTGWSVACFMYVRPLIPHLQPMVILAGVLDCMNKPLGDVWQGGQRILG